MKRLVLAALVSLAASPALAQAPSYQPIRVDLTVFGAYGMGDVAAYGFGAAIEPKYNLTDNLSIGLRFEGSGHVPESVSVGPSSVSMGARAVSAYLAKADWYFGSASSRPFVGVAAGLYRIGSVEQKADSSGAVVQRAEAFEGFGFAPQVGVNLGGFRLAATYHVITGGDQVVVTQAVGGLPVEKSLSKNYLAVELGGTFGGAKRQ
jgi:hypothetical protein